MQSTGTTSTGRPAATTISVCQELLLAGGPLITSGCPIHDGFIVMSGIRQTSVGNDPGVVLPDEGFAFLQSLQYEVRFRSQAAALVTAFRKLPQVLLSRTVRNQGAEQLAVMPLNMIFECGRVDG